MGVEVESFGSLKPVRFYRCQKIYRLRHRRHRNNPPPHLDPDPQSHFVA